MSKLPKNVFGDGDFDSPFKKTTVATPEPASEPTHAPTPERPLSVVAAQPAVPEPAPEAVAPAARRQTKTPGRKYTVYLTGAQALGLNERIFAMRAQGKTAHEANLTKVISAAVDYYLANHPSARD